MLGGGELQHGLVSSADRCALCDMIDQNYKLIQILKSNPLGNQLRQPKSFEPITTSNLLLQNALQGPSCNWPAVMHFLVHRICSQASYAFISSKPLLFAAKL